MWMGTCNNFKVDVIPIWLQKWKYTWEYIIK